MAQRYQRSGQRSGHGRHRFFNDNDVWTDAHHYSTMNETLEPPERNIWIFTCEDSNSISLFAMLGPEFEEQVDGRFTVTNGIPPVVRNMVQNEQEHKATRVELAKLKSDLGNLASSIVPLANWKNWLTQHKPRYNRSPHRVLQPSARNKCNWCWPKQCKTIHMEMKV